MVKFIRRAKATIAQPEFIASLTIISLVGLGYQVIKTAAITSPRLNTAIRADIASDLAKLTPALNKFEENEINASLIIIAPQDIDIRRSQIELDLAANNLKAARQNLNTLEHDLALWTAELQALPSKRNEAQQSIAQSTPKRLVTAPILIYHYTPPNFEAELAAIAAKGYTTIDLDQLAAAINDNGPLPAKPLVITFDDGFANQMRAFELLQRYKMKATFYIVNAGERSKYCIGSGRKYDQGYSCGDAYLNWDQVRKLDRSGLITIGAHTLDHVNLPTLAASVQRSEIFDSKTGIEKELGHPIRHFAYPYGSFSATTIALVRQAGFVTAVSTLPGITHSELTLFTLHRARDAFDLP